MSELFYIVFMCDKPILMSTLSFDGEYYHYKPYNLDICTIPRIQKEFKSKFPPHLLTRRTYPEGRPDITELLNKMGLKEYNVWEMIKISEGKLPTDHILFLTYDSLVKYGLKDMVEQTL